MKIKWQIVNPSTVFIAFDLGHNIQPMRIVEMELSEVLVSIFKFVTVGSDLEETITDLDTLTKTITDELYPMLVKKGLKFINLELIKIDKMDPIEFENSKSKYQRLNVRQHKTDMELNKDKAKFELGAQEVYVRSQMWG